MKELNWAPFLLLVCTLGNPSRAPEQGFLWYSGGFSAPCPNFTAYSLSLCALSPSLSFSVCMYSYALIPHPLCCPWPRMLTDANWGCRAQLGPIEAVYLIKTCEDPTGASAREDTASIYRFEHRRAHTPPYPGRARKTRNQVPLFDTGDPVYPSINMEKCRRNPLCNDISILPYTWFKSRCALMIVHTLTVCVIHVFFIM